MPPKWRHCEKNFTRNRKLPLDKIITFVLSIASSGKSKGVDAKSNEFFKNAMRSGLWPNAKAPDRSAVTRARKKVPWEIFEEIHHDAVNLAYEIWPKTPEYTWKGMSVFAIDGSKYDLPATPKLREEFDPKSGLENKGKGHYPQCLVSTAYDVFRRIPIARTVIGYDNCERTQAQLLIPHIPPDGLLIFDRGYPSFDMFDFLNKKYLGFYLFRSPASQTFGAVGRFIKSKKQEGIITLNPTNSFIDKDQENRQERKNTTLTLRVIRLKSHDGKLSVILTNLMDMKKYSRKEIIALYFRRWEVESYYRDEKTFLNVETFHSKTSNGIRQELFAIIIMAVIARILMVLSMVTSAQTEISKEKKPPDTQKLLDTLPEPQFKNAVMTLAAEAAILAPHAPEDAVKIFKEVLLQIRRIKYYRPLRKRSSKTRITKGRISKWADRNAKKRRTLCAA